MAGVQEGKAGEDLENGLQHNPPLQSPFGDESDESQCFSDAEEQPWHSPYGSHCAGSSFDEARHSSSEISGLPESCRCSSASGCSHEMDLKAGDVLEIKVESSKLEKDCRICQLSLDGTPESGSPIDLGCSCKHDLGVAHKHCAETWFKIKGNKICEICGSTAKNVIGGTEAEVTTEQWNETSSNPPSTPPTETRSFWQGHRFLNFLLACMVFAFVISWLFHFNVPG